MAESNPRKLSILLVDDHHDGADSLFEILKLYGFTAIVAYGATEALDAAKSQMPDVLISDIGLPNLNGCELAVRIAELGSKPVMIAITGFGNLRNQCMQAGFDHFFLKPYDPNDIIRLLQERVIEGT